MLVFGIIAPVTLATTVSPPDFEELVGKSDYVVRAKVKATSSEVVRHQHGRKIVTQVELEVIETISGSPPHPLILRMLGGRVGDEEMVVQGAPKFKVGDEDILFVQGNGRQFNPLVALMHGRYPIRRDPATRREFVVRDNGVPLSDVTEVGMPLVQGGVAEMQRRLKDTSTALSPADFSAKIRAMAQAIAARGKTQR